MFGVRSTSIPAWARLPIFDRHQRQSRPNMRLVGMWCVRVPVCKNRRFRLFSSCAGQSAVLLHLFWRSIFFLLPFCRTAALSSGTQGWCCHKNCTGRRACNKSHEYDPGAPVIMGQRPVHGKCPGGLAIAVRFKAERTGCWSASREGWPPMRHSWLTSARAARGWRIGQCSGDLAGNGNNRGQTQKSPPQPEPGGREEGFDAKR
jgi:hypothetical protein